jgi:mono/diheme cytochrome c family protein
MKKLWVFLVLLIFAAPASSLAGDESNHNTKIDYNVKCSKCHRETKSLLNMAKSLGVNPGKLTLRTSKMNRDEIIAIIEKGKDKMPGFENELTREQIADLADYVIFLKSRKRVQGSVSPTRSY